MTIMCLCQIYKQLTVDASINEIFYWSFLIGKVVGYKPCGVDNQSRLNDFYL